MTPIAAKTKAWAPLGHAVAIQKSSTAPTVTKMRAAFTNAGSRSGTLSQTERDLGTLLAGSTSRISPSSARRTPINPCAVRSASNRSDGVLAGKAVRALTAEVQILRHVE